MEQRVNKQNAKRNGKPFVVYGLICPITLEVKYVGQSIDLNHRNHGAWEPSLKQWLDSLGGYLRPHRVILERGEANRVVRVRVNVKRKPGQGRGPCGYKDVWLSSCLETKWIKRFQKTLLNRRIKQLPTVYDALTNPPLPWDEKDHPTPPAQKGNAL
jgi:hypothetical protein